MKNAGKARSYGLYRHLRTSKEIIENLLNYYIKYIKIVIFKESIIMHNLLSTTKENSLYPWYQYWRERIQILIDGA